jgi:hypothetical protein
MATPARCEVSNALQKMFQRRGAGSDGAISDNSAARRAGSGFYS